MERVAVLISGGVDSSLTAVLAKEKHKRVEGVTLLLNRHNYEDIERAKEVCRYLGLPHRVLDLRKPFEERVINYFINSYREGKTPNPCAVCNQEVKLGLATEILLSEGFKKVYTGHYVRKIKFKNRYLLKRAKDTKKDQTYFLALLKPKYLGYLEFPLGDYTKEEVRNLARELGLPTQNRKESQDICFLEGKKLGQFLGQFIPPREGNFIYKGKVVGKHKGYYSFTIGQRRGLGLRLGKPVYVVGLDPKENLVYVGDKGELLKEEVLLEKLNLFLPLKEVEEPLWGQVRYRTPPKRVLHWEYTPRGLKLLFEEPFSGVAPGQIGALYTESGMLVGGGFLV